MGQAARCIAVEKDRRTLDFLLATRLSSAEIIVGKLAAHMLVFLVTLSAGLPIMLLLNQLGGVDGWLILMAYAGIVSTGFFLAALSIWFSATAPDSRRALARAFLCSVAWFSVPFFATFLLPRLGVRLPDWLRAANAWLLASSPASLLMKLPSLVAGKGLIDSVAWMCGLQAVGAATLSDRGDRSVAAGLPGCGKRRGCWFSATARSYLLAIAAPAAGRRRSHLLEREVYESLARAGETSRSSCLSRNPGGDCLPDVALWQASAA